MGLIASKNTRRISFDNNFALGPSLAVEKIDIEEEETALMEFENISRKKEKLSDARKGMFKTTEKKDKAGNGGGGESDYWNRRIEELKQEHLSINRIIESEYNKTLEETNNLCQTKIVTEEKIKKIKPCFDYRSRIVHCYEVNAHQPLVCSELVEAFNRCVNSCRMED